MPFFADGGFASAAPSKLKLSFSTSTRGFAFVLAGRAGACFCFLAFGGVLSFESRESSFSEFASTSEFSSSDSGFARFFGFAGAFVTLSVLCLVAAAFGFGLALGAAIVAAFFVGAFAF